VLPADLNGKIGHVPSGFSGGHDVDPDDDQVQRWIDGLGGHNVALRLPDGPEFAVIGIDVDAYGDKTGDETVEYAANQFGAGDLPPTWSSTARGPDQPSRIWLYRVPPGRRWRSDLGRGSAVEIIQRGHRWARVWPSTNHRLLGRANVDPTYRWYAPDGTVNALPPRPEDLAELSEPWIRLLELAEGEPAAHLRSARAVEESESRGNFASVDGPALDVDGQPVDPERLLREGAPVGSQQTELFRYMCSLRARGLHREEMITLGMCLIQQFRNADGRDPWQASDVVDVVDHVRREYAPGGSQLSPGLQAVADRIAAGGTVTVEEPPLVEESATDLGNSLRFARLFADRCRYAADVGRWYVWDGRRWEPDGTGRVVDLTKHVIDDLRRQAFLDEAHRDEWLQWAQRSEALARRRATVEGAQSEPGLVVTSEVFDTCSDELVVRNGTVDLRTGELRESRPADLNSQLAEVDYDPDARHPRWDAHVQLLCRNDPELVRYLARAVGYSLTGDVGARAFFFLEGTGSNGKNAFIEPIMQLMGSYAQTASPSLLTGSEDKQHMAVVADLLGARLVFVDETRRDRPLNVERVKALTGSKRIKAQFMRQNWFEFEARFKLWIAGNGTPKMKDDSDGVWKRLHRVVCHGKVAPEARVDRYGDVLYEEEASGILNWALAGLLDWRRRGLAVPASVVADVEQYRHDENFERQFVEDRLEVTGSRADVVINEDLWSRYATWCASNGVRGADVKNSIVLGKSVVALELEGVERFHGRVDGRVVRGFAGLRWQE
jgi:P4 family phage/plasmid primase-like protien